MRFVCNGSSKIPNCTQPCATACKSYVTTMVTSYNFSIKIETMRNGLELETD